MAVSVSGFTSDTKLAGGHNGLIITKGATSKITITGSGLSNGLAVTIVDPPPPNPATAQWEGRTAQTNSSGTQCTAQMVQQKDPKGRPVGDDPTTVSVTAGDSQPTNVNTYTGTAPS